MTFRIAIVGTGKIAADEHLPAALASPAVEVAALVDTVPERARELSRRFGLDPFVTGDLADLAGRVDGAIIATPNATHAPIAMELVQLDIPVLVEKPFTTTVADGARLVEIAEARGVTIAVGYCWRFWDSVDLFRDLLDRDGFGRPIRFLHVEGSAGGWSPVSAYHLDAKVSGGGVTVVTGAHFLDRMLFWFGYPKTIHYFDDSEGGPEANSLTRLEFDLDSGRMSGEIRFSKTTKLESGFVLETERGVAVLPERLHAPIVFRPNSDRDVETVIERRGAVRYGAHKSMYQWQLEDFVAACRGEHAPRVSGRDALESVRLLETMYRDRRPFHDSVAATHTARQRVAAGDSSN